MTFCFFFPLQCYTIGDNLGLGIQGAVFRYQITGPGISLIPITSEIGYITSGIYQGKVAISVFLWVLGTFVLVSITILSLVCWNRMTHRTYTTIDAGIAGSCILYLASCICRYGPLFSGPSGVSLPAGILMLAVFAVVLSTWKWLFMGSGSLDAN